MVDTDSYAEPLSAMRTPVPLAVPYTFRLRGATARQWRTVPAEVVSEHFVISPADSCDWRDLSLTARGVPRQWAYRQLRRLGAEYRSSNIGHESRSAA